MKYGKIVALLLVAVLLVCAVPSAVCAAGHQTGWVKSHGYWYYYRNGIKAKGWIKDRGNWYYLEPSNCRMVTGWKMINGKWYYMNKSGVMLTGYQYIKDEFDFYYLGEDGAMRTGWVKRSDGEWTYHLSSGRAVRGWAKIGGVWYYFFEECDFIMAHDESITFVDGSTYYFGSSGAWIK